MQCEVRITWLEHELGTKFYQIFEFRHRSEGATLSHWGKMAITSGSSFTRPVVGGQVQLKRGRQLDSTRDKKKTRGYQVIDTRVFDVSQDETWWKETFGAHLAHQIKANLFNGYTEDEDEDDTSKEHPKTRSENSHVGSVSDARPESWGTW